MEHMTNETVDSKLSFIQEMGGLGDYLQAKEMDLDISRNAHWCHIIFCHRILVFCIR